MTNSTVLIADMGILVGIFLLGLLAKLFPKNRHKAKQRAGVRGRSSDQSGNVPQGLKPESLWDCLRHG